MSREKEEHNPILNFFFGLDYVQIAAVAFLLSVGLIFIYSTGIQVGTAVSRAFFGKQLQWIGVGTGVFLFAAAIDYRKLRYKIFVPLFYLICIALLVIVLFSGVTIFGAKRWLVIGGLRIQPSELAKLALTMILSALYSLNFSERHRNITWIAGVILMVLPFLLIYKEPDLGSAVILLPIFFFITFIAGLKWRYVFAVTAIGLTVGTVVLVDSVVLEKPRILKSYQRDRIRVFLNPESDRIHRGHNAYQARLAVGSGGLTGKGIGQGTQNELGFLPQTVSNNDFIFSVIAEETGFLGVVALLTGYALLFYTMLRTAFFASPYGKYFAVGIISYWFSHVFINIGMSLGITPVTGLPLPLISYGGSFIVSCMLALGILQSIYRHR